MATYPRRSPADTSAGRPEDPTPHRRGWSRDVPANRRFPRAVKPVAPPALVRTAGR